MNGSTIVVFALILLTMFLSVAIGLKYSHAVLVFGIVAVILSPFAIHKIPRPNFATGMLVGLALFAGFPLRKPYQLEGLTQGVPVLLIYAAGLWVIGMGWKRSWKQDK